MRETPKNEQSKPPYSPRIDEGGGLLPMLVAGLIMITIGYAAIMIFV